MSLYRENQGKILFIWLKLPKNDACFGDVSANQISYKKNFLLTLKVQMFHSSPVADIEISSVQALLPYDGIIKKSFMSPPVGSEVWYWSNKLVILCSKLVWERPLQDRSACPAEKLFTKRPILKEISLKNQMIQISSVATDI